MIPSHSRRDDDDGATVLTNKLNTSLKSDANDFNPS